MNDPRYPIGDFEWPDEPLTPEQRQLAIQVIESTPDRLRAALHGLTAEQIDTPYRPGGWSVRQLVHHIPDSHMNAYVRFKLALTEDAPTIRPYDEARWAELPEARHAPVDVSLDLLAALHRRWVLCLRAMRPEDFARVYNHPDLGTMSLGDVLALYAWHSQHHVAHVTALRDRMGWV